MREMENKTPQNIEKYKSNYSEGKLWKKVRNFAKKAGVKVIYMALLLYYVLKSPNVTKEDKAKIYGALGYFILPMDDALEANETFTKLMGDQPELRRQFIEENAKLVTDLDI